MYQPQSVYNAREFQPQSLYNGFDQYQHVNEKLPPDAYSDLLVEDEEESDKYYSDEEEEVRCCRRPQALFGMCLCAILAGIIAFIVNSLPQSQTVVPTMIPPMGTSEPVVAPHIVPSIAPAIASAPAPALTTYAVPSMTTQALYTLAVTTTRNPLLPAENRHDSNVCNHNEEEYAGLCYKKCSLLTDSMNPIRTSSWTCCEREPCTLGNSRGDIGTTLVCKGFDVDGDGNCPHEPGACLTNEELLLGVCYKKCSQLTDGKFPVRVGPATCCMSNDLLGCFNVRHDKTSPEFNIGGGVGDHDAATPGTAHRPITNLTESARTPSTSLVPSTMPPGVGGHVPSAQSCQYDEELYAGLCYKKCVLLTGGKYAIRTSSWTCCESHPCGLHNQKGSIGKAVVCNGFDVGGSGALKLTSKFPCPHKPMGCDDSEEMFLGVCYTKCSVLTDNQFPFRVTAATCCKEMGIRACLDIRKVATSASFNVGIVVT